MRDLTFLVSLLVATGCRGVIGLVDVHTDERPDTDVDTDTDTDTDTDSDTSPRRPIADAGPDIDGLTRAEILLDGSRSYDPDGDVLTYHWTLLDGPEDSDVTLIDADAQVAALTTRRAGEYTLELRVDDGELVSEPDTAVVRVDVPYVDGDTFDPGRVWLWGTAAEGSCSVDVFADPLLPNSGTIAFPCYNSHHGLTDDGRLIYEYRSGGPPRVFRCDGDCTLDKGDRYPREPPPQLNDPTLPHPCDDADDIVRWFHGVGGVLYQCRAHRGTGRWLDAGAAPILSLPPGSVLVARGHGGDVLHRLRDTSGRIYWRGGGSDASVPIGASIDGFISSALAVRALPEGGFRIAVREPGAPAVHAVLYEVSTEGELTRVGDYPDPPEHILSRWPGHQLDADGRLWHQGQDTSTSRADVIVRRTLGGRAEVVYTEESDPLVKLHSSDLVTAP